MPANQKVSAQQIMTALLRWHGRVAAAADELGLSRKRLYERIGDMGIASDVQAMRVIGNRDTRVSRDAQVSPFNRHVSSVTGEPKKVGVNYRAPLKERRFSGMESAETAAAIPERPAKRPNLRVRPAVADLITDATFDMQYFLRRGVDEQKLFDRFLDEQLGPWLDRVKATLREQEAAAPKTARRGGKRAQEGDDK